MSKELLRLALHALEWGYIYLPAEAESRLMSFDVQVKLRSAIDAPQPSPPAWLPIETAPKDGQCLLWVATDDGGEVMKLERDAKGAWIYDGQETFAATFYMEPTHWMPLPDAP